METQKHGPPERDRHGQKEKQKQDSYEEAESLRWTDSGTKDRALTELFAGLLGPLRHLGKWCKALGLRESGVSRLWT